MRGCNLRARDLPLAFDPRSELVLSLLNIKKDVSSTCVYWAPDSSRRSAPRGMRVEAANKCGKFMSSSKVLQQHPSIFRTRIMRGKSLSFTRFLSGF